MIKAMMLAKKFGFNVCDLMILTYIAYGPGSLSEMTRDLDITPSMATRRIQRLVADGLINIHKEYMDNRLKVLELTDRGNRKIKKVLRAMKE